MAREVAERRDVIPVLAEIFREYGVEGASLAIITARTGLGKGSLYHFFPGGKDEMVAAVLDEISEWFEENVFSKLADPSEPRAAVLAMLNAMDDYFHSGARVCLVGALSIDNVRDRFFTTIHAYFARWREQLATALRRIGCTRVQAATLADEIIVAIQGSLVLARAIDDPGIFTSTLKRYKERIAAL